MVDTLKLEVIVMLCHFITFVRTTKFCSVIVLIFLMKPKSLGGDTILLITLKDYTAGKQYWANVGAILCTI